jgi:drug/metabolite transporter (DMT)-like permease
MNQKEGSWRAELGLVFNTLIWGSTFVVVQQALHDVSTLLFLALRFGLATLALALVFRRRVVRFADWRDALQGGCLAGLFLFAGYLFQTVGLRYTSAPNSAFLTGLSIVLVPLLGAAVYRKRLRWAEMAGASVALVGMGLMTLPGSQLSLNPGDMLTVLCAVAFAGHILVVGHYALRVSYESIAVLQVAVCALLAAASFGWAERVYIQWSPRVVGAVVVTGLLATALAFAIQAWAQQYTTPTRVAIIFALEPVFAWITSYLVEGVSLTVRASFGAGLILTGILLVELKPVRAERHP